MKNRWKFKRKLSFLNKYINGTNGVISLFLAILMVPFASIAGVLVNSARINSAVALFDEALCSASNSTLGTYDKFLRERFGLLAMDQNTASHGSGYSVQQLIQDTFKEYMDKNTEVLSNTYDTSTVSATGVYPLADTDVLLSQVYEASKYTVPAKLVIDGFSIEDMIKALTKDLSSVTGIFNTISSSASVVDKVANCDDKFTSLNNKIKSLEESKTNYDNAYNEFKNAVDEYNLLIDEINNKKAEIQKQIDGLNDDISDAEKKFKEEKEKVPELAKQIEDLENEKDADGKPVNNKEKIKKIEEDNKDKLKDYLEAKNNLKDKQDELKGKKDDLNKVEESYSDKLNTKRQNVTDKKNDYSSKIGSYASSVKAAGDAAADAQNSITELQRATNSLITDVSNQMYSSQKKQIDDTIEDYGKKKEKAKNSGDTKTEQYYNDEITKLKDKKTKIDNDYTLDKAVSSSSSAAVSTIKMFSQQDLKSQYSLVYGNLIELKNKVDNDYDIVYGIKKMCETSLYYISGIQDILTSEQIEELQKNLSDEICSSSFFTVMKTIISFIKALFKISLDYDPELTSTINTGYYRNSIGGLPSKKSRIEGGIYSLKSPYQESDKKMSDYFKTEINSYSNSLNATGSINGLANTVMTLISSLNDINECCDKDNWHWYNVWSNLKKLGQAIWGIVSSISELICKAVETVATAVGEKFLLSGYIGYNIPNRTTYTGIGLMGKAYSLPNAGSAKQGYAFYGAETEYILNGSYSETENQEETVKIILAIRLLFNIYTVFTDMEVEAIASAAGSVTFGIGTVVVYMLYLIAEPTIDTVILANGGSVAIKKNTAYLTPTGIIDLIGAMSTLKLSGTQKNDIYTKAVEVSGAQGLNPTYTAPDSGKIIEKANSINYTKMLIIMMLFTNYKTLLNRLSDVIQMEASYNAATRIDSYVFDLDKCFTYLRASGNFSTNQFIKLSNSSKIYSKNRIVYRGY